MWATINGRTGVSTRLSRACPFGHPASWPRGIASVPLWIPELFESLRDTLGVFCTGLNENVDVLRRARATVDGHRLCPDDDELSVVALE
jgi:hypothetical protein